MACISIPIHHETARLIREIDVPGDRVDSSQFHITLLNLGNDTPIKQLAKAMTAVYEVLQNTQPFRVKLCCLDYFDIPENVSYPIMAPVQSIKLHEINLALKRTFNKKRITYDKRFKEYKPHITLSMSNEAINNTKIEPIEFMVQDIVLWSGDSGDNKFFATFPLELPRNEGLDFESN